MFNTIVLLLLAIIVIIISKGTLESIRVLRYKGYDVKQLSISRISLIVVLYVIVSIMCFL